MFKMPTMKAQTFNCNSGLKLIQVNLKLVSEAYKMN